MKMMGSKSMADGGKIMLASTLLALLSITLAFAYHGFEVSLDKESYYPNEDIYILVSGPGNTGFTVKIIDPGDRVVSEKKGKTTASVRLKSSPRPLPFRILEFVRRNGRKRRMRPIRNSATNIPISLLS